nr:AMP-binding protein [Sporichthya sp.]
MPRLTADFDAAYRAAMARYWLDRTLLDHLDEAVAAAPDKPAVIGHVQSTGSRHVLTRAELADRADRIAAGLLDLGVQPGQVVSVQLPNWWQLIALHLACRQDSRRERRYATRRPAVGSRRSRTPARTVSGPEPGQRGPLIELTWNGTEPLMLKDGTSRTFLEDGDTVTIRASAPAVGGGRLGFGEVTPARFCPCAALSFRPRREALHVVDPRHERSPNPANAFGWSQRRRVQSRPLAGGTSADRAAWRALGLKTQGDPAGGTVTGDLCLF